MLEYKDLNEYLNEEYPYIEDVVGLLLDIVNGVEDTVALFNKVQEFKEHNGKE